jgi:hypothetical protein
MRPAVGYAVTARGGEGPVGIDVTRAPCPDDTERGLEETAGDFDLSRGRDQPADLGGTPIRVSDPVGIGIAEEQRRRRHRLVGDAHQTSSFSHPGVDDRLLRLSLQLSQHDVGGEGHSWQHGRDMQIHQPGELITIVPADPSNGHRHGRTS